MMRKIFLATLLFLIFFCPVKAQNKTFSLDELFYNRNLYPGGYNGLQWMGDGNTYSFLESNALMSGKASSDDEGILVSLEKLNQEIKAVGGSSTKRFPVVNWLDDNEFLFTLNNDVYHYSITEGKASRLHICGEDAENMDITPSTYNVAFTIKNNLFVGMNQQIIQVTADPDTGIVNGKVVHRNEWGIEKGTFWSPNGQLLAFYHMDESMVTNYPLVDIKEVPAVVENTRYPMAGMNSHQVKVGVFDPVTKKTIYLKTGEPLDQFLTNIAWTPDNKYILIAVLNREQDHMWLNQYDALSGQFVRTLFEETDKEYVEPLHPAIFLKQTPTQYIWMSERDGFMHLYLYDLDAGLIRQLTSGPWEVNDFLGLSKDEKTAWFTASKESPLCKDLYSVELKSGKINRMTRDEGMHDVILSGDGSMFIDDYSNITIASVTRICSNSGKTVRELYRNENPLKDYAYGQTRIFTIKSDLGDDLYCRMILPPDFDSTRRYPVIVYVYGGPHNHLITNSWLGGSGMFLNYLATQGYIVFSMDNHGTYNRGQDFEQVIHRQVGVQEVKDQMKGVEYLRLLPYVDRNRIGVHGWSYGGFMTISLLVKNPDTFKVGVAGGPVCNWKYYEVMYGERYMDTPQENAKGYEQTAVTNYTKDLKASLLIIHGSMDPTVVQQNSLDFIEQCVNNQIPVDYFVYPNHGHNVSGIDRLHLYKKIEAYFKDKL